MAAGILSLCCVEGMETEINPESNTADQMKEMAAVDVLKKTIILNAYIFNDGIASRSWGDYARTNISSALDCGTGLLLARGSDGKSLLQMLLNNIEKNMMTKKEKVTPSNFLIACFLVEKGYGNVPYEYGCVKDFLQEYLAELFVFLY
jgi:hypothetical protein